MATIEGKWAIEVATLAGSRRFDLTLMSAGTTVTGHAVGSAGPARIRDGTLSGDAVVFTLDYAMPLPTSLVFTLRVIGSRLIGSVQSGPFPPSTVVGMRLP